MATDSFSVSEISNLMSDIDVENNTDNLTNHDKCNEEIGNDVAGDCDPNVRNILNSKNEIVEESGNFLGKSEGENLRNRTSRKSVLEIISSRETGLCRRRTYSDGSIFSTGLPISKTGGNQDAMHTSFNMELQILKESSASFIKKDENNEMTRDILSRKTSDNFEFYDGHTNQKLSQSLPLSPRSHNLSSSQKQKLIEPSSLAMVNVKPKDGSLLRLFQSECFDAYLHMYYLYHRQEQGIHEYLVNLLYSKRLNEEILFYLPQLCQMSVLRYKTSSLHRFLLDKASSSMHFAFKIYWIFQSIVEDKLQDLEESAQKMTQETEMAVVNCRAIPYINNYLKKKMSTLIDFNAEIGDSSTKVDGALTDKKNAKLRTEYRDFLKENDECDLNIGKNLECSNELYDGVINHENQINCQSDFVNDSDLSGVSLDCDNIYGQNVTCKSRNGKGDEKVIVKNDFFRRHYYDKNKSVKGILNNVMNFSKNIDPLIFNRFCHTEENNKDSSTLMTDLFFRRRIVRQIELSRRNDFLKKIIFLKPKVAITDEKLLVHVNFMNTVNNVPEEVVGALELRDCEDDEVKRCIFEPKLLNPTKTFDSSFVIGNPTLPSFFIEDTSTITVPNAKVKLPSIFAKLGNPLVTYTLSIPIARDSVDVENELLQFIMKQRRCDYFNTLNHFVSLIIDVSNALALEPDRLLRNDLLAKFMDALNEWLLLRRCIVAIFEGTFSMTGLTIPLYEVETLRMGASSDRVGGFVNEKTKLFKDMAFFDRFGDGNHSTQILRIISKECKVMSSKKRAPYLIVFEIADLDEDLANIMKRFCEKKHYLQSNDGDGGIFNSSKCGSTRTYSSLPYDFGSLSWKNLFIYDCIVKELRKSRFHVNSLRKSEKIHLEEPPISVLCRFLGLKNHCFSCLSGYLPIEIVQGDGNKSNPLCYCLPSVASDVTQDVAVKSKLSNPKASISSSVNCVSNVSDMTTSSCSSPSSGQNTKLKMLSLTSTSSTISSSSSFISSSSPSFTYSSSLMSPLSFFYSFSYSNSTAPTSDSNVSSNTCEASSSVSPSSFFHSPFSSFNTSLTKSNTVSLVNADKESATFKSTDRLRTDSQNLWGELWKDKCEKIRRNSPYGELESWELKCVLVKGGDDLRQELLASQLIKQFKIIFDDAKLPLWLRPYEVLVTGCDSGIMEFVPDTYSVDILKKKFNTDSVFRVFEILFADNPFEAKKNFIESHAAYSLVSYFLQVKDRHNGNLLLDADGHLIHIDFGFMLSNSPGNFNFETSPFKLTREYLDVMDGEGSDNYEYFRTLIIRGFLETRKHADKIILLVEMTLSATKMPCFAAGAQYTIDALKERFMTNFPEEVCIERIIDLINSSVNNFRTVQYDNFQRLTNGIL